MSQKQSGKRRIVKGRKLLKGLGPAVVSAAMVCAALTSAHANGDDAPSGGWMGPYIGIFGGGGGVVNELSGGGANFNGIGGEGKIFGAMAGYNVQLTDRVVMGVQGEIAGSDLETKAAAFLALATLKAEPKLLASVSGRVGWLATADTMLYALGGYTHAEYEVNARALFGLAQANFRENFDGFHIGAGIETKISDRLTARVEYRYTDFGGENFGAPGGFSVEPSIHAGLLGLSYNLYPSGPFNGDSTQALTATDAAWDGNWSGFYVGGYLGGSSVVHDITALPGIGIGTYFNGIGGEGIIGGGLIGYNHQVSERFVLGVQGEIGFSDNKTELTIPLPPGTLSVKAEPNVTASVSGRLGWLATPGTMLYALGGFSFTDYEITASLGGVSPNPVDQSFVGPHVGAGIEVAITDVITGRLEYRYSEFESKSLGFGNAIGIEPSTHAGTLAIAWHFGRHGGNANGFSLLQNVTSGFSESEGDGNLTITGAADAELRVHDNVGRLPRQEGGHLFPTIGAWVKADYRWNNDADRIVVQPYGRVDLGGTDRSLFDLQHAYYLHDGSFWDFLIGVHTVYWGVAESRHLVNVINQTDVTADVDEEDKLGQPMINLNLTSENAGTLSLYGLFGFRGRRFAGPQDRLRGLLVVNDGDRIFERGGAKRHVNFAARYSNSFTLDSGSIDFAASYFYGTNRNARFTLGPGFTLTPIYEQMHQAGLETVYSNGNLQLKFEGIYRDTSSDNFFAGVGGFEYTFNDAFSSGVDVGILGEYMFDERRTGFNRAVLDDQFFAGLRAGFNDEAGSALLTGVVFDFKDGYSYVMTEYSRRLKDDLELSVELRHFNLPANNVLNFLNSEDFAQIKLRKYF